MMTKVGNNTLLTKKKVYVSRNINLFNNYKKSRVQLLSFYLKIIYKNYYKRNYFN